MLVADRSKSSHSMKEGPRVSGPFVCGMDRDLEIDGGILEKYASSAPIPSS
jgi:hypothetical protein